MSKEIMMPPLTPKDLYEQDEANRKYLGKNKKIYWPTAKEEQENDRRIRMENERLRRGITKADSERSKSLMNNDEWFKTPYYRERLKREHAYGLTEREEAERYRKIRDLFGRDLDD